MIDAAEIIKSRVTCRQFADFMGLSVNRAGFAVCPFHGDNDASLKIYKGDRGWCCFGCHKGGDVINLASLHYGLGFKDTLRQMDRDFNLGIFTDSNSGASDGLLAAIKSSMRKLSREREERAKRALDAEYWAIFDRWINAERTARDNSPQLPDEPYPEAFCKAVREREIYREWLTELEMRRIHYDPR